MSEPLKITPRAVSWLFRWRRSDGASKAFIRSILSDPECDAMERLSVNLDEIKDIEDPPSVGFWSEVMSGLELDCTPLSLVLVLEEFDTNNKRHAERSLAEWARRRLPGHAIPEVVEKPKKERIPFSESIERLEAIVDELKIPMDVQISTSGAYFIMEQFRIRYDAVMAVETIRRMIAIIRSRRGICLTGGSGGERWQPDSRRESTVTCVTANT